MTFNYKTAVFYGGFVFFIKLLFYKINIYDIIISEKNEGGIPTEAYLYGEVYLMCIFVVGLLLIWYWLTAGGSTPERWIRYMLSGFLASFSFNFLFNLFSRIVDIGSWGLPVCYLCKTLFHVFLVVGLFGWCGYADTESGRQSYARRDTRNPHYIPFVIPIVFIFLNLKTKWIFSVDASLHYHREWMYQALMIYQIIAASCLSISLIYNNRHEQEPQKLRHILVTSSFPIAMLVGWLLSFLGEYTPVICAAVTVELLCLALGNSTVRISIDKLTNVNNRNNLIAFLNYKLRYSTDDIYLLMIDVDHFKKINDEFGHLEGDDALVRTSKALKVACAPFKKRPYIARFGGDEFIIIIEGEYSQVELLCRRIHEYIREQSKTAKYDLEVSIGIAKYEESMTYNDFIKNADEELYKQKDAKI